MLLEFFFEMKLFFRQALQFTDPVKDCLLRLLYNLEDCLSWAGKVGAPGGGALVVSCSRVRVRVLVKRRKNFGKCRQPDQLFGGVPLEGVLRHATLGGWETPPTQGSFKQKSRLFFYKKWPAPIGFAPLSVSPLGNSTAFFAV